jgi:hypothetical protein
MACAMLPTRTAIERAVNTEEMRSRQIAPPNGAWGFGLGLLLVGVLFSLADYAIAARQGLLPVNSRLVWLPGLAGNCIGMFAAGFAAYSFVRLQAAGRMVRTFLLAGLTFALAFPFKAFVAVVVAVPVLDFGYETVADFIGSVLYEWWTLFRTVGWELLIVIVLASTVSIRLTQASGAEHRPRRSLNATVGGLFVAFGVTLATLNFLSITYEIETLAVLADRYPQERSRMQEGAGYLQGELWGMVVWRSLPFLIVGGLLIVLSIQRSRPQ